MITPPQPQHPHRQIELRDSASGAQQFENHPWQHVEDDAEGQKELRFNRKALGLGPAIWNSALSGGFIGRIVEYGRDEMILASED